MNDSQSNPTQSQSALAQGMLRIAIQRMIREHPFHAHLLSPERFVCDPEVGTMGVAICDGRIEFRYAPEFVTQCSYDELIGVLQHEVNHLIFGHVLADPAEYPDSEARIIAEEVTVNEWVTAPLPGQSITLDQFPALKPLQDTKERYDFLARKTVPLVPKPVQSGPKTVPSVPKSVPKGPKTGPNVPKSGSQGTELFPVDNHDIWANDRCSPTLGKMILAAAVRDAMKALDDVQQQALPTELREGIEKLAFDNSSSDSPGTTSDALHGSKTATIDWRRQLRHYIAQSTSLHPAFHRPPRRMPSLIGILPAQCRRAIKPLIMAVIDTSSSMDVPLLEAIEAELRRLAHDYQVVVVECDAEIQTWYPYRNRLAQVHGRGGTDLRPPFEAKFLAKVRPDVIVYFTEGEGPAPSDPPPIPVIWCLTPDGVRPVPWGKEIRIQK